MQQVRIFKGVESDTATLQDEINAWLRQSGVKVLGFTGNIAPQTVVPKPASGGLGQGAFSPSDVVVIVLYESPDA
jgi:hypothetical protein